MKTKVIKISEDFSRFPSGRFRKDGPNSGERFREDFLLPALEKYDVVEIWLDGVRGYPSSFSEEAFGGLVRKGIDKRQLIEFRLRIKYSSEAYHTYKEDIELFIKGANYVGEPG